jgi:hypothetical protein
MPHQIRILQKTHFTTAHTMSDTSNDRVRGRIRTPLHFIGIAMTVIYLALGAYILFIPGSLPRIPADYRTIFASMLIIYGLYRGWRTYADNQ